MTGQISEGQCHNQVYYLVLRDQGLGGIEVFVL
jgi:hypothetical protein